MEYDPEKTLSAYDTGGISEALGYLNSYLECPGQKSRGLLYVDWQGGSLGSFSECDCYDDLTIIAPISLFAAFAKRVAPGLVRAVGRIITPSLKKVAIGKLQPWLDSVRKQIDELTANIAIRNSAIDNINQRFIPIKNRWMAAKEEYNLLFARRKLIDDQMSAIVAKSNRLSNWIKNAFGERIVIDNNITIVVGNVPKRVRGRRMPDGTVEIGDFEPLKYFYDKPRPDFEPIPGQLTEEWIAEWQSMVDMLHDGVPSNLPEGRIKNYLSEKLGDLDGVTTDPENLLSTGLNKIDKEIADKKLEIQQNTDRMLEIRPQIEEDFEALRSMRREFEVLDREKIGLNSRKNDKQLELNHYQSELQQLTSAGTPEEIQSKIDQISESLSALGPNAPNLKQALFSLIINVISTVAIKEKHQCANGAILDENECRCSICLDGKELCDVETLFNKYALLGSQLPLSRMGDELNFCLDECQCGFQQVPRPFAGGSLRELLNWIGAASPCYCGCEDKKQNPYDPDPVPYKEYNCNKAECGFSTTQFGKACDTEYPPEDLYGNLQKIWPDWQHKQYWDQFNCEWKDKSCEKIIFNGSEVAGEFIPGRTSLGLGECKYSVTCYACEECPSGKTLELSKSEAEGKSCQDLSHEGLSLFSSCEECEECDPVFFGGAEYQGSKVNGECIYTVQCFQCDNTFSSFNDFEQADCEIVDAHLTKQQIEQRPNCNDWSVVDKGREIKRWNSCAEADCRASSSSSSCGSIVFAGVEYQGFSQNNECLYRVTCYSCDDENCVSADADITESQALQYPNCDDWSSSITKLFNSCEAASCECPPGFKKVESAGLLKGLESECVPDCNSDQFQCLPGLCCVDNPITGGNECLPCESSSSSSSSCPPDRDCNGTCCPEDYSCVAGACCPPEMVCNDGCCPEGEVCVNNQCCPYLRACGDTCCPEDYSCEDGECLTDLYFCKS